MDYLREKNKLETQFNFKSGLAYSHNLTLLTDKVIVNFLREFPLPKNATLLAHGGYGRKQLAKYSDIDLLLLLEEKNLENDSFFIEKLLNFLWSFSLETRPLVFKITDLEKTINSDFKTQTSLLETRFLAGSDSLYADFKNKINKHLKINKKCFVENLCQAREERFKKTGFSALAVNIDIKNGAGTFRDINTLSWLSLVVGEKILNLQSITAEVNFILKLRNAYHLLEEVKGKEILTANASEEIAQKHGFANRLIFLAEFYKSAFKINEYLSLKLEVLTDAEKSAINFKKIKEKIVLGKALSFVEVNYLKNIEISQNEWLSLLKDFFKAPFVGDYNFLNNSALVIIAEKLIPQFESLKYLAPKDPIHQYTVGAHLILTVQNIKLLTAYLNGNLKVNFKENLKETQFFQEFDKERLAEIENIYLLSLAALIHDIAKIKTGDHSEEGAFWALEFGHNFDLSKREVFILADLIKNHLILPHIATKRDLSDYEMLVEAASKIKNIETLNMLYVLVLADSLATSHLTWTSHRVELIRTLFHKLRNILLKTGEEESFIKGFEELKQEVLALENVSEVELSSFLNTLPDDYLLSQKADRILKHFKMWQNYKNNIDNNNINNNIDVKKKVFYSVLGTGHLLRTLSILTEDKKGLLATLAGAISALSLNIVSAQVFTTKGNLALDVFTITPPPDLEHEEEVWLKLAVVLNKVVRGEKINLRPVLQKKSVLENYPVKVIWDNKSSRQSSILEVHTLDRAGLLRDLANIIYENNLSIEVAKIDTVSPRVIDVFYLRDNLGEKITNIEIMEKIKIAILQVNKNLI